MRKVAKSPGCEKLFFFGGCLNFKTILSKSTFISSYNFKNIIYKGFHSGAVLRQKNQI
jgi:hypothetical protein